MPAPLDSAPQASGLPPLTPRPRSTGSGGLPPLRPAAPAPPEVVRVREVTPRWRMWLLVACAVLSAVGGLGSLYLQFAGGDEVVERVAPMADLAIRTNNGIARVDAAVARVRELTSRVRPGPVGEAPTQTRVGPFVIRRGPGYLELRPATP